MVWTAALLLLLQAPAPLSARAGPESPQRIALTGFVEGPDGAPGEGALVVSSAGGQAVAGVDGAFRLEVELPPGSPELRVTAVRTRGALTQTGSLGVTTTRADAFLPVGTLALTSAGTCEPAWLPTFGPLLDLREPPFVLLAFDDGRGPALYAGGSYYVARLDGTRWVPLGTLDGLVLALAAFDDGRGPALYAAGTFANADGVRVRGVARWDGQRWNPLGNVIPAGMPTIRTLAVHDDGSGEGPSLYVGGTFLRLADGTLSQNLGRWNKRGWSAVDTGSDTDAVVDLTVFDDRRGGGAQLYALESYRPNLVYRARIRRWDGARWSLVEDDFTTGGYGFVTHLEVFDDPLRGPPALVAAGDFSAVAGVLARNIARWDGTQWSALEGGPGTLVRALAVVAEGPERGLYAGGEFGRVSRWNGTSWEPLAEMLTPTAVFALATFDDGRGSVLYAGSGPDSFNGAECRISRWDGQRWSTPASWLNGSVLTVATFDDGLGGGPALYAGGTFSVAGGVAARAIARWDGQAWSSLGTGVQGEHSRTSVYSLVVHDDGSGPALFAGGEFVEAGGRSANNVAKWDGTGWTGLGSGLDQIVFSLALFEDGLGGGPALYAGGFFTASGPVPLARVARWDGTRWTALGSGMNDFVGTLAVHDDGSGPALFAGGRFTTAGGVPALRIARWDGALWSPLGGGTNSIVDDLCTFDDGLGGGPALYVAGRFTAAGGRPARSIARWDGVVWSALGSGLVGNALALAVFDDGSGPALHAGGHFVTAGGVAANRVARWDGTGWSPLGSGLDTSVTWVDSLTVVESTFGAPALLAGGNFLNAGGTGDSYLGRWQGCGP